MPTRRVANWEIVGTAVERNFPAAREIPAAYPDYLSESTFCFSQCRSVAASAARCVGTSSRQIPSAAGCPTLYSPEHILTTLPPADDFAPSPDAPSTAGTAPPSPLLPCGSSPTANHHFGGPM